MSYRDRFVGAIKDYYQEGHKKRLSAATIAQREISLYLEHLKADLSEELKKIDKKLEINVFYIENGLFGSIRVEDAILEFYRKPNYIEIWGNQLISRDYVYIDNRKLIEIKGKIENLDELMDSVMIQVFTKGNFILLNGELDIIN
ncbi:hypothetical protein KM915_20655 [Cytobacillus oceanisediminis]|uniref:hypothetical protein n=1 Tax=Cytobacillus oceanisediminis TaxID=665099 RepID=UPI001C240798|nr:hypothetical protein [Cytobacillus oceanisediminis]MBU8732463.1 hypothetical protein [Cytobacillus oceanisediminis]